MTPAGDRLTRAMARERQKEWERDRESERKKFRGRD